MTDIIDGNLKLILGMIWTLILRFTIADIRFLRFIHPQHYLLTARPVKKAYLLKKACCYGVKERQNPMRKSKFKISHSVGQTGSLCSSIMPKRRPAAYAS